MKGTQHQMKTPNTTPHDLDRYSAKINAVGRRTTKAFSTWLSECERHDAWHELPAEQREPTLENVKAFLDDYSDWSREEA